jgi:hypothetical protein
MGASRDDMGSPRGDSAVMTLTNHERGRRFSFPVTQPSRMMMSISDKQAMLAIPISFRASALLEDGLQ